MLKFLFLLCVSFSVFLIQGNSSDASGKDDGLPTEENLDQFSPTEENLVQIPRKIQQVPLEYRRVLWDICQGDGSYNDTVKSVEAYLARKPTAPEQTPSFSVIDWSLGAMFLGEVSLEPILSKKGNKNYHSKLEILKLKTVKSFIYKSIFCNFIEKEKTKESVLQNMGILPFLDSILPFLKDHRSFFSLEKNPTIQDLERLRLGLIPFYLLGDNKTRPYFLWALSQSHAQKDPDRANAFEQLSALHGYKVGFNNTMLLKVLTSPQEEKAFTNSDVLLPPSPSSEQVRAFVRRCYDAGSLDPIGLTLILSDLEPSDVKRYENFFLTQPRSVDDIDFFHGIASLYKGENLMDDYFKTMTFLFRYQPHEVPADDKIGRDIQMKTIAWARIKEGPGVQQQNRYAYQYTVDSYKKLRFAMLLEMLEQILLCEWENPFLHLNKVSGISRHEMFETLGRFLDASPEGTTDRTMAEGLRKFIFHMYKDALGYFNAVPTFEITPLLFHYFKDAIDNTNETVLNVRNEDPRAVEGPYAAPIADPEVVAPIVHQGEGAPVAAPDVVSPDRNEDRQEQERKKEQRAREKEQLEHEKRQRKIQAKMVEWGLIGGTTGPGEDAHSLSIRFANQGVQDDFNALLPSIREKLVSNVQDRNKGGHLETLRGANFPQQREGIRVQSRHITAEDRFVYQHDVQNNILYVLGVKGHYEMERKPGQGSSSVSSSSSSSSSSSASGPVETKAAWPKKNHRKK